MKWLFGPAPAGMRAEIFQLGGRHHGEPLSGAVMELSQPGLTPDRRRLLRAVVKQLRQVAARA